MRKLTILALGLGMAYAGTSLAGEFAQLDKGTHSVRLDVLLDEDHPGGTSAGFEIGYGVFCDDNYELSLLLMLEDDNEIDQQAIAFSIEQNFDLAHPIVPYLGALVGYGWLDAQNELDNSSAYVRGSAGIKLFVSPNIAFVGGAQYSIAREPIYLDDNGVTDNNVEFNLGIRCYF